MKNFFNQTTIYLPEQDVTITVKVLKKSRKLRVRIKNGEATNQFTLDQCRTMEVAGAFVTKISELDLLNRDRGN
ncbi:MAG: hypothetical protein HZR80_01550 [Candidatus Heimdallarchaeota archaeon]